MGFDYYHLGGEENEADYIEKFKEIYNGSIVIPEGIEIFFVLVPDSEITHIWRGGKQGPFNQARAVRISWIKEVLLKKEKRIIKYIPQKRCVDFITQVGKTCFVVRCVYEKKNNRYRFLTSFIKGGKITDYCKYPDFDFDKIKSC